ncbi:3-hydroxyacyl-CoA dehydrogenase/enoyl-CoA hydratase family protein [Halorientalis halophila]|uniref:3-hydroxyacyl-CoA dehydrogenase/enoyl-CoA hydratase family protein n=1 Tax=Halorientalis halophila TaxID=3108499 RepID=UPI003008C489
MQLEDIETIAVLGAGNMGHGIAEVAAIAGYDVRLRDIKEEFVQSGYEDIEWSLKKLAEKDTLTDEEAEEALANVTPLVDMEEAVGNADVIIEAVPEQMEIKEDVYAEVEEYAPDRTLFATNTSSLSITDLSEVTDRKEQFCGMHFFNPPIRMDLVEVINGAHTADETVDAIVDLAEDFGKTPVRVRKDSPGFIVNRILVPLMNEACWMLSEDVATVEEIDSTTKYHMGLPMGSFELADMTGIDISYHVLDYMHDVLGDEYEPAPIMVEKVENEELGQKTGKGFYDYEDGDGADVPTDEYSEEVEERLNAALAKEIANLVGGDVAPPEAIDEAVMMGAGFPEGPTKTIDEYGVGKCLEKLETLYEETGAARYEPPEYLSEAAEQGGFNEGAGEDEDAGPDFEVIAVERIDVDVPEGHAEKQVGHVKIDRPHRMNTISLDVLDELEQALDILEDDEQVRAILVTGEGEKAFSAGADVQSMATSADPLSAQELSAKGQSTFGRLEESPLPVVAGIDGFCLGGGMELSMCTDIRIASERSEFGQPELDLGLLPGWGGTQRLKHVIGEGPAKEIIMTAERYEAAEMEDFGFLRDVVSKDDLFDEALELAEQLAQGPPVAQKMTKRAMLKGRDDTDAGLEVESQAFGHLIGTDDVMEGMTSFMGDSEPDFEGQ